MKAIVYYNYGSPDVLRLEELEKPIPKDNEVLIEIHAASINSPDWRNIRADPFFMRLTDGILRPKNNLLGLDFAGRIEAIGSEVKQFRLGDEVFGDADSYGFGTFAEYKCMPEEGALAIKPANLTYEQAAAVPSAAVTALQGLRDKGQIQHGQKVLINGASGGIGTFAVQIAKSFGAEVTGVCSTKNLDLVRSIGADHVIDYTEEDFTRRGQRYDLILDIPANRSIFDCARALGSTGRYVMVGFTMARMLQALLLGPRISKQGGKQLGHMGGALTNRKDLDFLRPLIEDGKIKPVVDRRYKLRDVPEAIRYYEKGHAQGKVVITMEHNYKS